MTEENQLSLDIPSALFSIITTATVLQIGNAAGGVALIPYLIGQPDPALTDYYHNLLLGLLLSSSAFYLAILIFAIPAVIADQHTRQRYLAVALTAFALQGTLSTFAVAIVMWSLLA